MTTSREELRKQILNEMNAGRIDHKTYIDSEWLLSEYDKTLHQELQKAREEERKIIKLRIDYDRRKGIPAEETVNDIYDSIELKNQSELDQPTEKKAKAFEEVDSKFGNAIKRLGYN